MHISSNYAKILGETNFRTRDIPQSGSKAKDGEREKKKEKRRLNDGENNGQATHSARKHAWGTQAAWAKIQTMPTVKVVVHVLCKECDYGQCSAVYMVRLCNNEYSKLY